MGGVPRLALRGVSILAGLLLAVPAAMASAGPHAPGVGRAVAHGSSATAGAVVEEIDYAAEPTIALGDAPVTLSGTLAGSGLPAGPLEVIVRAEADLLPDRAEVAAWAASTEPATGPVIARGRTVPRDDRTAGFRVAVPIAAVTGDAPYGAVRISIEIAGRSVHGFVPFQRRKEYEPLRLAVGVPVVGTADPRKLGTQAERNAAWQDEADPDGRLLRLLDEVRDVRATLVLDPALLDSGEVATPTPGAPTPTPTPTTEAPEPPANAEELAARQRLAEAIRTAMRNRATLRLPPGDPDIAAASAGPDVRRRILDLIEDPRARPAPTALWPAAGGWTMPVERVVDGLDPLRAGLALADSAWLRTTPRNSVNAGQRTRGGTPLLVADHDLSARVAQGGSGAEVQAFLADTVALLAEWPSRTRSVLVLLPRTTSLEPVWSALREASAAPWIVPVDMEQIAEEKPTGIVNEKAPRPAIEASPLHRSGEELLREGDLLSRTVAIRADAATYRAGIQERITALMATSWRGKPAAWQEIADAILEENKVIRGGLTVPPRDINFLADSGRIRIVVENGLDVPVEHLRVRLDPLSPQLRIETQPIEVAIGARSRTAVTVAVTALAAGEVPIRATLLAPDGTEITSSTSIRIRVTPTGAGVYWAIGGVAVIVLALGLLRTRRAKAAARRAGTLPA